MKKNYLFIILLGILTLIVAGYFIFRRFYIPDIRSGRVTEWLYHPDQHPDWAVKAGERCADAPFILPTSGFIGYLWGDSWQIGQRHQGIDIFGGTQPGQTPVVAAIEGYLSRQQDWKSTLAIRLPADPLNPAQQVWTYYTHMADPQGNPFISDQFPPGTSEVFVEAGTLLGYQGNFSGDPTRPTGVHLHFSIVLDNGKGGLRNELDITNTQDPSPYFGLSLNGSQNRGVIPICIND
jgi:peptidoglycan LD-endopeptidase LytH